jgi:cytochrome c
MNTDARTEVRDLVQNAVALCEEAGKDAALAEIADKNGRFVRNGYYTYALDLSGTMLAHPVDTELTGRNLMELEDSSEKPFVQRIIDLARTKGYGFIDYIWHLPFTKEELRKTVFLERVDELVLCCGFYTTEEDFLKSLFKCYDYAGPM